MGYSNNQQTAQVTDMYQLDPLGLLYRKFWSILFFIICCIALSLLYFFKAPKTFESTARVYIEDRRAPTMSVEDEVVNDATIEKYLEIINSRAVLAQAIEACDEEELKSLTEADDVFLYVRENLIATPSDTKSASGVMRLRFQSGVEEDCQIILTNIISAFENFITQDYEDTGVGMLSTMNQLEKDRAERFSMLMKEIDGLMKKPFIQVIEGKVYNQYEGQAAKHQIELDTNAGERLRFVALRDNLMQARNTGESIEDLVVDTIQDMNEGQLGGYTTTHQTYLELKVREKEMMGEFGGDHPELQNVRQQIKMVDGMRKEQLLSALRSSSNSIEDGDFFSVVMNYINNRIRFFESHETQLAGAIKVAKVKSLEITKDCERLSMLLAERELMTANNFDMQDKVQEYNVLQRFDWQDVRVIDPATPAEQIAPDMLICLAGGLLLGSLLGFIFGAMKEMAEKTFRSTDDVTKQLGVDVVAQIAKFSSRVPKATGYSNIRSDVITLHQPQSPQAESFKALRTSIFFRAKQESEFKLIQITSPTPGDGKSVVSSNLAVVMAQSGRKVLLIDCDLRRQTQHLRFGAGNNVGITSVIAGESEFEDAVQETPIQNLYLLASGPPCANPAEILTTSDFAEMLRIAKQAFDFVIVDTPPVLPVTDPVIISSHVDAVFMPIRIRNGVQVKSQKAVEALALVGRKVDGVIINGLSKKEAGSYSYGGYGGYGYGYGGYSANKTAQPIPTNGQENNSGNGQSNGKGQANDSKTMQSFDRRN